MYNESKYYHRIVSLTPPTEREKSKIRVMAKVNNLQLKLYWY